jgi:ACR3 family arsenite efflux pump ArsB
MKKFLPVIISLSLFLPAVVAAQVEELPQLDLIGTLETIASLVFTILIAISLIFLVYAGILFVTAAGSAEQVEKARHIILYAIIGLVVAALAWGIREFLRSQLGF